MPAVEHWVFGYGSLMWRPGFAYVDRQAATLHGRRRAFCQARKAPRVPAPTTPSETPGSKPSRRRLSWALVRSASDSGVSGGQAAMIPLDPVKRSASRRKGTECVKGNSALLPPSRLTLKRCSSSEQTLGSLVE